MKNSTITLYYKSLINKDKNFILDNPSNGKSTIENYLGTLENEVITGFQYIKHSLVISIKLDKSQDYLNMGLDARDLNYIKIQNDGENAKYYFIVGKTWKGESTIELMLNMDTLNSFQFNKDYVLNKKTLVKREHKDRFAKIGQGSQIFEYDVESDTSVSPVYSSMLIAVTEFKNYSIEILDGTTVTGLFPNFIGLQENHLQGIHVFRFIFLTTHTAGHVKLRFNFSVYALERIIDMRSEEINSPVYKINEDLLFEQDGNSSASWSLFYRNADNSENSPVDCYLLADEGFSAVYQTSDGKVNYEDTPADGDFIIFWSNTGLSINVDGAEYYLRKSTGWSWGNYQNWTLIAIKRQDTQIEVYYAKMEYKLFHIPTLPIFVPTYSGSWSKIFTGQYVEVQTLLDSMHVRRVDNLPSSASWCTNMMAGTPVGSDYVVSFGTTASAPVVTLQAIDKTDSKNIKIIDLPYSPTSFSIDGSGNYELADMWKYDQNTGMMKLRNNTARFTNDIRSNGVNPEVVKICSYESTDELKNMNRKFKDSKLLHSDFYRPKFVYDSFSRTFPLEKIKFDPFARDNYLFHFHFTMSRNIVSKFMFSFDYEYKIAVEDFEKVVTCSRNNEEVLYNSAYLNYIRTGYNYDLKSKERQDVTGAVGIGLSVASIVGSVILAVATENPLPLAGAVAGGISLVGQTVNYAKTTAQNEDNIQRKLQETQQQAVAVINADDVDLLYEYCQNKAKLCTYKVSDQMESILDDLFYYGGYISNEQKIPNVRSRYWFNYVQASLVIEESDNLTEEIENDIKEKFENGVTFMHNRFGTFDLKQEKENMETSVVGG